MGSSSLLQIVGVNPIKNWSLRESSILQGNFGLPNKLVKSKRNILRSSSLILWYFYYLNQIISVIFIFFNKGYKRKQQPKEFDNLRGEREKKNKKNRSQHATTLILPANLTPLIPEG